MPKNELWISSSRVPLDKWCTTAKHDIISQFYVQFSDFRACACACARMRTRHISKGDDKSEFVNIFIFMYVRLKMKRNTHENWWLAKKTHPVKYVLFYTDTSCSHSHSISPSGFSHPRDNGFDHLAAEHHTICLCLTWRALCISVNVSMSAPSNWIKRSSGSGGGSGNDTISCSSTLNFTMSWKWHNFRLSCINRTLICKLKCKLDLSHHASIRTVQMLTIHGMARYGTTLCKTVCHVLCRCCPVHLLTFLPQFSGFVVVFPFVWLDHTEEGDASNTRYDSIQHWMDWISVFLFIHLCFPFHRM